MHFSWNAFSLVLDIFEFQGLIALRGDDEATELIVSILNTTEKDCICETALLALQRSWSIYRFPQERRLVFAFSCTITFYIFAGSPAAATRPLSKPPCRPPIGSGPLRVPLLWRLWESWRIGEIFGLMPSPCIILATYVRSIWPPAVTT